MIEIPKKHTLNIDSEEYLSLISHINSAFETLRKELSNYHSAKCNHCFNLAYQAFVDGVKEDLKH